MGHQPRPPLALLRPRLRLLLHTLYPSFTPRANIFRPLAIISILFVLTLVSTGVYLVIPFTLLPQLGSRPAATLCWLALFLWCIICTVVSYLLSALASPGKVPESWRPRCWQKEDPVAAGVAVDTNVEDAKMYPVTPAAVPAAGTSMLRADGRYRYCVHCNVFKPDRAHHCSSCHECVLQMDHHCPFTGNSCVGFLNRKFFMLFLYYATLSCTLVATLTPGAILTHLVKLDDKPTSHALVWIILVLMGYLFCLLHAVALAPFSLFHTYLVLKNRTTIENQELASPLHNDVLRRMDRGWLNNWKATFGPRPLLWFVPVAYGRQADGIDWSVRMPPEELV